MKYALVTGGGRGIGRAISIKLAEMGYNILINYKSNKEEAEKTLELVNEKSSGELMQFNVADRQQVEKILQKWFETNPEKNIEILINNAGLRNDSLLVWMENTQWDEVIAANLNGFYNVTKIILNKMIMNGFGRIINIASLSGQKGVAGQVNYAASKAGLIGASRALAQEVGRRGITVNVVAPGFIKTDMTGNLNEAELKKMIPLNRFGEPEEIAEVVGFLASEKSSYITGEIISVNGGLF